tara:strand:+ start:687 stop:3416 length:2730 start_codon:yes stop_codon:yes gene_type:complete
MSIPGSASPLFLTSAAAEVAGYQIDRSLRFNSADSAYLNRTPSSAGNSKTFTWSGWVKQVVASGTAQTHILAAGSSPYFQFYFAGPTLYVETNQGYIQPTRKFRDPSAWYHFVVAIDTTQATATNRIKFYVNGEEVTDFAVDQRSSITQNTDLSINSTVEHRIGRQTAATAYSDMYLAEVHFVDGQQLEPTDFGEFDSNNLWQPKDCKDDLTYGTNGFYLKFADNSSNAALGTDSSGNSNTWTVNNISGVGAHLYSSGLSIPEGGGFHASYPASNGFDGDTSTFTLGANTSTSVRWTYNSSFNLSGAVEIYVSGASMSVTFNDGRTAVSAAANQYTQISSAVDFTWFNVYQGSGLRGNITAVKVGGTVLIDSINSDSLIDTPTNYDDGTNVGGNYATFNPLSGNTTLANGNLDSTGKSGYNQCLSSIGMSSGKYYCEVTLTDDTGFTGVGIALKGEPGSFLGNTSSGFLYYSADGNKRTSGVNTSYGNSFTTGDAIGIAFDADNGNLYFYKNGVAQNSGTAAFTGLTSGPYFFACDQYNTSNKVTINFGQRPFAYTPPTGYAAGLCTTNLPDPTIADGSTAFDVVTYTGNGTSQTIDGLNHSPDLVWAKSRSFATNHGLIDTVRGVDRWLGSNTTSAEDYTPGGYLTAFNSDGFSVGYGGVFNSNNATYVAWAWDAGSSTVSNTDGSITSNVRANASAGFSIVTYTGTGSTATIGHGLNAAPGFIVIKSRTNADAWPVYHQSLSNPANNYLLLYTANAVGSITNYWNGTNSSVIGVLGGYAHSSSGQDYVAYCWAPVEGYSAFGSYIGSQNFPFVYCGFRPRFLLIKPYDLASGWQLYDSERNSFNTADDYLAPNEASAEVNSVNNNQFDFLSNGFVPRGVADSGSNYTGYNFLYAAYAEHPFKTARAR